jgi:hypothetical protein
MADGPSVHYTDVVIPLAEDSQRVRMLASAFKMLGSSAFRVAASRDPQSWPFNITFDGTMESYGVAFDVAITVTITKREETTDDHI